MEIILRYDIPKQYKISTNKIYAWIHWTKRTKISNYFHDIVRLDCLQLNKIKNKVNLEFEFYFKSRYLDSSNCSFMWKCLEDWLVEWWLFIDDSNKYIWKVSYHSIEIEKKQRRKLQNDYIRIIIKEIWTT